MKNILIAVIIGVSSITLHAEVPREDVMQIHEHITQGLQILERYRDTLEAEEYAQIEQKLLEALDAVNAKKTRACAPCFFNCSAGVGCSSCARLASLAGAFATLTATPVQGACFTVQQITPTTFLVSFLTPFSVPPVVLVNSNLGFPVQVTNVTNTSFTVTTSNAYGQILSFIAQQAS